MGTKSEICDWLGITPRALDKHLDVMVPDSDGKGWNVKASIRAIYAKSQAAASGRGGLEQVLNLTEERALLAREQRIREARRNAVEAGELAPVREMQRAMSESYRKVRSRILAVPQRVRQILGHIGQMEAAVIDRELRDALAELGHADD